MQGRDVRTYDGQGRLASIAVPWIDGQHHPTLKVALFVGVYGSVQIALFLPLVLFAAYGGNTGPLIVWSVLQAICLRVFWYCWKRRDPTEYPCNMVVHVDGRMEFTTAPGSDGRARSLSLKVGDIQSIEYSLTKQWTTLDPKRYVVKEWEGEWYDVFALLTNGRRMLLARNVWDRDYNHELALLLGDAIREVQDLLKPSPGNASAGASRSSERNRRVVN